MPVKNVETNEVHKVNKGGTTHCGFDTTVHPENWVSSSASITCEKDVCK